jgi:hypothetical protein
MESETDACVPYAGCKLHGAWRMLALQLRPLSCTLRLAAAAAVQEDTQRYWRSVLEAPPGSPSMVPQLTQVRYFAAAAVQTTA